MGTYTVLTNLSQEGSLGKLTAEANRQVEKKKKGIEELRFEDILMGIPNKGELGYIQLGTAFMRSLAKEITNHLEYQIMLEMVFLTIGYGSFYVSLKIKDIAEMVGREHDHSIVRKAIKHLKDGGWLLEFYDDDGYYVYLLSPVKCKKVILATSTSKDRSVQRLLRQLRAGVILPGYNQKAGQSGRRMLRKITLNLENIYNTGITETGLENPKTHQKRVRKTRLTGLKNLPDFSKSAQTVEVIEEKFASSSGMSPSYYPTSLNPPVKPEEKTEESFTLPGEREQNPSEGGSGGGLAAAVKLSSEQRNVAMKMANDAGVPYMEWLIQNKPRFLIWWDETQRKKKAVAI